MFSGILKAIGAQFYGAVMSFIGFYLIGLPLGLVLMLKTHLKVYGNYFFFYFKEPLFSDIILW